MILIYLAAIVAANLITAHFGPVASIYVAFALIGLDLVARDALHTRWHHNGLVWKMGLLIVSGSALSYVLNQDAGPIALASCLAFGGAAIVDALVYHPLRHRAWLTRSNASNVPSALADSLIFPTVAFGGFLWPIVLGQFAAKVLGGAVWSLIIGWFTPEPEAAQT